MVYKFKYVGYGCLTVMLYGTLGYSSIKTQNGTIWIAKIGWFNYLEEQANKNKQ